MEHMNKDTQKLRHTVQDNNSPKTGALTVNHSCHSSHVYTLSSFFKILNNFEMCTGRLLQNHIVCNPQAINTPVT